MFFKKKKIKTFVVFNYYFYICTRNLISAQEIMGFCKKCSIYIIV